MTVTETTTPTITATAERQGPQGEARRHVGERDYPAVADEIVGALGGHPRRDRRCPAGDSGSLDVAAGTGTSAIPAARGRRGHRHRSDARTARRRRAAAEAEGLALTWRTADAEDLPFDDAEFDVVMSCIGVMFAPHHQAAADELVRVCRPGGTIGVLSWTPEGFIGQMFATMKPYAPPPPPGASPAPLWGHVDHVRELFGDRVTDLVAHQQNLRVDRFAAGAEFRDFFKTNYGPTIAVYRFIADDPERSPPWTPSSPPWATGHLDDGVMEWEYLLVTGIRR